jgi:hypothetical protein
MTKIEEKKEEVKEITAKGFRANADIEVFYRFVHENNLREEARVLLQAIVDKMGRKRRTKTLQ